jgi:glycerol-3-phosphate dehydrogenase (NAD(P)+)
MGTKVTLSILGGGSWGTALAIVLAPRFERLRLWVFEPDLAARMTHSRENDVFLPGLRLPENVEIVTDLHTVIDGAGILLGVVPSHYARSLYERVLPALNPSTIFVSATKGLESGTLLRMSQVLCEVVEPKFEPSIAVL